MRARTSLAFTAILLGVGTAAIASSSAAAPEAPASDGRHTHAAEVARIQAHFDSVLAELPMRDVASLPAAQRERRADLLATLRTYRDAGVFPHNYDFPGQAVPYFVDRRTGTLCAVAYLVASTGRRDIVDRVARMDNNVLVPDLAGDTAFTRWLDDHGLTVAEAARIQVPYVIDEDPISGDRAGASRASSTVSSSIALGSAVAASLWTARANANGTSKVGNVLGMIAGATALGVGANTLGGDNSSSVLGAATMAAGATSAWLSTRGVLRYRRVAAAKREADRATVAPLLPVDGKTAGVTVTLRF